MEVASAPTGQINLFPFQFAAAALTGAQSEEGVANCCNPFMTVLQRILQGSGCQPATAGAESGAKDGVSPAIEGIPGVLFSSLADALMDGTQTQAGAQFDSNPAVAAIQGIEQLKEGLAAPKELAQRLFSLLTTLTATKPLAEPIGGSKGEEIRANDTDDASQKSMEQAILIALTQLLSQYGPSRTLKDEATTSAEDTPAGDVADENESWEELLTEIFSALSLLDDTTTTPQALPAHPAGDDSSAEGEELTEILSDWNKQAWRNQDLQGRVLTAEFHTEAAPGAAEVVKVEPESEDKIAAPPENVAVSQTIPQSSIPITGAAGIPVPPVVGYSTVNVESAESKEGILSRSARTTEISTDTKTMGADQPTITGAAAQNEESTDRIGQGEARHPRRTPDHASVEQAAAGPVDDMPRGETFARVPRASGNDLDHHAKVLYSRLQTTGNESQKTVVNGEQAASQATEGIAPKSTGKTESLIAGAEPQIVKLESSAKSHSFAKGDGDSNSMGQGMATQKAMEKGGVGEPEAAPFGDIVADRIARMAEHIAQTNRSDLTLRLKIDGNGSVLLEMKERAGKMVIGIQCQDKTLMKALENQKDTMVRNLEMKNLNATISVSTIGEDEGDQQRQWQRGRHEQHRENWGTRGEQPSAPYFEAVL
jgi:hypothetical protein